jgi:hypothetical protein
MIEGFGLTLNASTIYESKGLEFNDVILSYTPILSLLKSD